MPGSKGLGQEISSIMFIRIVLVLTQVFRNVRIRKVKVPRGKSFSRSIDPIASFRNEHFTFDS